MIKFEIKQQTLCEWLWEYNKFVKEKSNVQIMIDKIKSEYDFEDNELNVIEQKLKNSFLTKYKVYWNSASRKKDNFLRKQTIFGQFSFVVIVNKSSYERSSDSKKKMGRPSVPYENLCVRSKRRKLQEIRSTLSKDQLAALVCLLKNLPFVEEQCEKDIDSNSIVDKVLTVFMDLKLSRADYETLRKHNEGMCDNKIYPPYAHILDTKKRCYPEKICITERKASVDLQSLLDHTTKRLLLTIEQKTLVQFCNEMLTFNIK